MIAQASMFRAASQRRMMIAHVRYQAPADLLPWADPYIASLFADDECRGPFAEMPDEDGEDRQRFNR